MLKKRPKFCYFKIPLSEKGAAAIEYALLAGLIAVSSIGSMRILGESLNEKFTAVGSEVEAAGFDPN